MQTKLLIQELEIYLSLCPKEANLPVRPDDRKKIPLLNGEPSQSHWTMGMSEPQNTEEILKQVLDHCNEETLDELMQAFGEDSMVVQIIRRRMADEYCQTECDLHVIGDLLAQQMKNAKRRGNPFYETVCRYMERIGYQSDAEFYNAISMPRQQFARLRNPENTLSKRTVLWIIVGLRLNYQEANDLLRKAGYHFRNNDMRDVLLTYIFRNTAYDLDTVNHVLEHFHLPPFC